MDGIHLLILGLVIFFASHLFGLIVPLRRAAIAKLGDMPYKGVYSLVALVGITVAVMGYGDAAYRAVYTPPPWTQWIPVLLMPLALFFFVGAYLGKDVVRITRHPQAWGLVLWGGSHLAANGDLASVLLFGSFTLFGIIDMPLGDTKMAAFNPEGWQEKRAQTSILPFAAIMAGRAQPKAGDVGVAKIAGVLVLYGLLFWGHAWAFGQAVRLDLGGL